MVDGGNLHNTQEIRSSVRCASYQKPRAFIKKNAIAGTIKKITIDTFTRLGETHSVNVIIDDENNSNICRLFAGLRASSAAIITQRAGGFSNITNMKNTFVLLSKPESGLDILGCGDSKDAAITDAKNNKAANDRFGAVYEVSVEVAAQIEDQGSCEELCLKVISEGRVVAKQI